MGFGFSYKPYTPFGTDQASLYITRLVPDQTSVTVEWLGREKSYAVKIYRDGKEINGVVGATNRAAFYGLEKDVEYALTVTSESGQAKTCPFRTGDYRGAVINYLHQDDLRYAYSGRYLATPSIVRFKGDLWASFDVFRGSDQSGGFNLTLLYRSKDDGKTWEYVTDLVPCFWGTLFVANDKLCILACATEGGSLLVSASKDGENWESPTFLLYGAGERSQGGPHRSATPPCYFNGKLYFSVEFGGHCIKRFDSLVASVDLNKDVLDCGAWTFSKPCMVEFDWGGDQDVRFAIEGNMVERGGEIFNLLRFNAGKALMLKYDPENPKAAPNFYKAVDFPLGHCKFFIQKAEDGTYYAMGNDGCYPRHRIDLYKSTDLERWEKIERLVDVSGFSAELDGVQYPSFVLEGKKFYTVLRTGLNGAHTFHDTNAVTFKVFTID